MEEIFFLLTAHHKDLDRENDEDVVDVETRVCVVECEETVYGKLTSKVVVFAA